MVSRALLPGLLVAHLAMPGARAAGQSSEVETVPDGVRVETGYEYYELRGGTLSEVVETLNGMRLEGADAPPSQGLTRYWIEPEWRARAEGGECRVDGVEVSVEITITLPRWVTAGARPDDEVERWRRIERAIREHELGHRDLTIEAAGALRDSLQGLSSRGCGRLRDVVASTLSVADGRLRAAHAELDRETPARLRIGPGGP